VFSGRKRHQLMSQGDELKASLEARSTDDLTSILEGRDEEEWRPEVFGLVESILKARGAGIPVGAKTHSYSEDVIEDRPLVTVGKYFSSVEAHAGRSILESAGLEAWVADETLGSIYGVGVGVRLRVRGRDESSARELLAAAELAPAELPPGLAAPSCPSCGAGGAIQTSDLMEGPDPLGGNAKLRRFWFYDCQVCGHRWPDDGN
jgi:hypothetical protein